MNTEIVNSIEIIDLKKYYVYALMNADNVFYIGKGSGERAYEHAKELENQNSNTNKHEAIKKAKANGTYRVKVIGRYDTEKEAFAVESTLIHWMYGFENLTNDQRGHGSKAIREQGNFLELPGIDIPEKIYHNDGTYSNEFVDNRANYKIKEFMQDVKKELENQLAIELSEVSISEKRWTRIFYVIGEFVIHIYTENTSTKSIGTEIWHVAKKKNKIEELCLQFEILNSLNNASYAKYNKKRTKDIQVIVNDTREIISILEKFNSGK